MPTPSQRAERLNANPCELNRIESGKPIPPRSKWAAVLHAMKPGDSIFATEAEASAVRAQAIRHQIQITSRKESPNCIRLWRL